MAAPLPAGKVVSNGVTASKKRKRRTHKNGLDDDTPKEFQRLMQLTKTGKRPNGLDDGIRPTKKQKKTMLSAKVNAVAGIKAKETAKPTIMPGERLSDFAARVNQAFPISGLSRKAKKVDGIKERRTRTERKITKMQDEWRRAEERRKEKEQEAEDLAEEEAAADWTTSAIPEEKPKKRKRNAGQDNDKDDDDPWAVLKARRGQPTSIHDVVQAPPTFTRVPKEKFKMKNNGMVDVIDIPKASGSLAKREALAENRKSVVERYRQMMESKRQ